MITRERVKAITGMVRNHLGKYKSPRKRRRMLRSWSCQSAGWCKRHHKAYPPVRMGCIPLRCSTVSIRHRRCRRHRSSRDHDSLGCKCRCSGWLRRRSRRHTSQRRTRRIRWEEARRTPSAASAVEDVGGEIGAMIAATGLPQGVAVISAGPAVRVVQQVAAHPAASGGRAADVISAGSADAAGVAVACPTGRQAL